MIIRQQKSPCTVNTEYFCRMRYKTFSFHKLSCVLKCCYGNIQIVRSSSYFKQKKLVFYFDKNDKPVPDTEEFFQTVKQMKDLRIPALKGGFQRRPELIQQRVPVIPQQEHGSLKSYGLFDKCERIQGELTERALALLGCEQGEGRLMLDIGCGHGWSLTLPASRGFQVSGVDLDLEALAVVRDKQCSGFLPPTVQVTRANLAHGLGFRPRLFDFAISISLLQWLCVPKNSKILLNRFFSHLQSVLRHNGRACCQFYPRNVQDVEKVILSAEKHFNGALYFDFPHIDRGRKLFLVLMNNKL